MSGTTETVVPPEEPRPIPEEHREPPRRPWVLENLFSTPLNTVLTIAFGALVGYVAFRALRFVFFTGRWEIIEVNLRLFMVGLFPTTEYWRLWAAIYVLAAGFGMVSGVRREREEVFEQDLPGSATETEREEEPPAGLLGRLAVARGSLGPVVPVLVGLIVVLQFTSTLTPTLLTIGAIAVFVVMRFVGHRLPIHPADSTWLNRFGVLFVAALVLRVVLGFMGVDGAGAVLGAALGYAFFLGLPAILLVAGLAQGRPVPIGVAAVILSFWIVTELPAFWQTELPAYCVGETITACEFYDGVPLVEFEGLLLTLVASAAAIVLSFPLGVGAALARRSSFPAFRMVATAYIELIRGVPLITLLFMGRLALGLFLPPNVDAPDLIIRSIAMMTLFTGAYVAEIVRGGLQSVPLGQVEGGLSVGLSPLAVTRLIVLPQALRNVIPAMVGQFISLFKDSSLLTIISVNEILNYADIVRKQDAFLGQGLVAETLGFVAFIYWIGSYSMSRASQRLESKLGVGTR